MDDLHSHPLTRRPFFPAQHALALCGSLCTRFIMPIESKTSTSQSDALPTLTETHSAAQIFYFLLSLSLYLSGKVYAYAAFRINQSAQYMAVRACAMMKTGEGDLFILILTHNRSSIPPPLCTK